MKTLRLNCSVKIKEEQNGSNYTIMAHIFVGKHLMKGQSFKEGTMDEVIQNWAYRRIYYGLTATDIFNRS
jgi:hypothetical protein